MGCDTQNFNFEILSVTFIHGRKVMQHVNLGNWNFTSEPFDKFETSLCFGRNKRDRNFIPTKVRPNEDNVLPQGKFKVIKTQEKGTIMIVPGDDTSKKILLFAGVSGGFRGGVYKLDSTTANVIKEASASAACESGYNFAAVLDIGQFVDVYTYGRYGKTVFRYTNIAGELETKKLTKEEYDLLQSPEDLTVEEL